jgi:hypothetical protein
MTDQVSVPESLLLSEAEVQAVVEGKDIPKEEVVLPSDKPAEELIAGKFKSQEELLKAYKELESKLGTKPAEPVKEEVKPTDSKVNEYGFDVEVVNEYANKFNANGGKLTDENYTELEAKGYKREQVELYIEGALAREQKKAVAVITKHGTVQEFQQAVQWAQQAWSPAQLEAYNKALNEVGDNTEAAGFIVGTLMQQYKASNGMPLHSNNPGKPKSVQGYATKSDMIKDMDDPRYSKDPAYRAQVEQKMALTDTNEWYKHVSRGL